MLLFSFFCLFVSFIINKMLIFFFVSRPSVLACTLNIVYMYIYLATLHIKSLKFIIISFEAYRCCRYKLMFNPNSFIWMNIFFVDVFTYFVCIVFTFEFGIVHFIHRLFELFFVASIFYYSFFFCYFVACFERKSSKNTYRNCNRSHLKTFALNIKSILYKNETEKSANALTLLGPKYSLRTYVSAAQS